VEQIGKDVKRSSPGLFEGTVLRDNKDNQLNSQRR
jgi:hypothetical protein